MNNKLMTSQRTKHEYLAPLIQDLVHARKAQHFTQNQLAQMSGVSRRTVVLIESGGDCTLSTLSRIASALGLQIHAQTRYMPTLDDVTRENEAFFSSMRLSKNI